MKNKISIIKKNQKGQAALLIVLITMMLLLFVGLTLTSITMKRVRMTRDAVQSVQAYYLADAGTERLLYLIKGLPEGDADKIKPSEYSIGQTLFDETIPGLGNFVAEKTSDSPLGVKVTGYYKNTARAVELSWN